MAFVEFGPQSTLEAALPGHGAGQSSIRSIWPWNAGAFDPLSRARRPSMLLPISRRRLMTSRPNAIAIFLLIAVSGAWAVWVVA
jgi:hypothetical protein